MSKLLTEPKTGYVKPKDGVSSGIYPKTIVDAVYNEEKGESLSETLKNLESRGGGGDGDVLVLENYAPHGLCIYDFADGYMVTQPDPFSSKAEAIENSILTEEQFDKMLHGEYKAIKMISSWEGDNGEMINETRTFTLSRHYFFSSTSSEGSEYNEEEGEALYCCGYYTDQPSAKIKLPGYVGLRVKMGQYYVANLLKPKEGGGGEIVA